MEREGAGPPGGEESCWRHAREMREALSVIGGDRGTGPSGWLIGVSAPFATEAEAASIS